MEGFLDFLANHYIWFLLVAILLIFALIGYLIDSKNPKDEEEKMMPKAIEDAGIQTTLNQPLSEVVGGLSASMQTEESHEAKSQTLEDKEASSTVSETLSTEENKSV